MKLPHCGGFHRQTHRASRNHGWVNSPSALKLALIAAVSVVPAISSSRASTEEVEEYPHGTLELDCSECHTTEGWRPLREPVDFDHSASGFPLLPSHQEVPCTSCHRDLDFPRVPTACADCHADPHRGELGFGCESCHIPAGWDNRRPAWDRHSGTLFPLTGVHASLDCAACHQPLPPFEYANTPIDCYACHSEDYANTTRPDHVRANFPKECEACHTPLGWTAVRFDLGGDFDHEAIFPLTGAHRSLDCSDCHQNGFAGTPTDCFSCHQSDYEQTRDPDHVAAGFPTDCEVCHDTRSWEGADLDHDQFFRLTGAHRSLDCEDCHADRYAGTPTGCYACHLNDYEATTDPDHVAAGFAKACRSCHDTRSWQGAILNHDEFFRLTGGHRGLDCQACHSGGFKGTPTHCYACHKSEYNNTKDPDHSAAGFPRSCESCHNTRSWQGADFDHDLVFRLTGAHRGLDCDACHSNGFKGTPTDCYACHESEYRSARDPDHAGTGFPTDCEICHGTARWDGADFSQHDGQYFPIYSGRHRGEWDTCADCHTNPSRFSAFECIECHEHNKNDTDDKHDNVTGYVYSSAACYECHPTGNS